MVLSAAAVTLAFALDLLVAEPPARVHPVALFGRVVGRFDRTWDRPRAVGVLAALALPLGAAGVAAGATLLAVRADPRAGVVVAGLVLFSTTSYRLLLTSAMDVVRASDDDVAAAREALPALVGRDPADLSPAEVRSAAVESVAENLADGLVGPLLAFAVAAPWGLPAAAAAAAWVKAVNTLDSMLGYREKPVGWASARLDDAVMWVPARTSAFLLAFAAGKPRALVGATREATVPASPNSGWPMATLAHAVGVGLRKPGAYALHTTADLPSTRLARRAVAVAAVAGLYAYLAAALSDLVRLRDLLGLVDRVRRAVDGGGGSGGTGPGPLPSAPGPDALASLSGTGGPTTVHGADALSAVVLGADAVGRGALAALQGVAPC